MTHDAWQARSEATRRMDYRTVDRRERYLIPYIQRFVAASLAEFAATSANAIAIDAGCGEAPFRQLIERAGFRHVGIDVRQNTSGSVALLAAIDKTLPAEAEALQPADLMLCTEVLEHLADWQMAFANMRRLLKPGGILIVTCPFLWPLHEQPYDFWRPTPHAIRYFAERFGFEVVTLEKAGTTAEAISTILGHAGIVATPGPLGRLRRAVLAATRAAVQRVTVAPALKLLGRVDGNLYLANLAVLRAVEPAS